MATPLPRDYATWTLEHVRQAITGAIEAGPTQAGYDANAAFVEEGDHWQGGDGWVGPPGPNVDAAVRTRSLAGVERQFTPVDAVGEVLGNVVNALLKREPDIDFVPLGPVEEGSAEEERLREQAEDLKGALSAWWDRVDLWALARQAATRSRWAMRGALRCYIAEGNLVPTANGLALPTGLEREDAYGRVDVMAPTPDAALVYTHPVTRKSAGLFLYEHTEEGSETTEKRAEIWYLDDTGRAVVRLVNAEGQVGEPLANDLSGRLPVAEMGADLLITDAIRRQQARLNFAESLLVRVAETGGFPERYVINAKPHGEWSSIAPSYPTLEQDVGGVRYYLWTGPRTLGASMVTELQGVDVGESGTDLATPSVVFKEPTDPTFAITSANHARYTILRSCKQGHLANDSTAEASGVAYEQARAGFEADLEAMRGPLETLLRETLEAAVAMADAMSGGATLDTYRVAVTLHVSSGPILPAERAQDTVDMQAGKLSRQTAMARAGVEDVDAEMEKLDADPEVRAGLRAKQMTVITGYHAEGMTWERAATVAGVEDEELMEVFRAQDADAATERAQEDAVQDEIDAVLRGTAAQGAVPAVPPVVEVPEEEEEAA